MNSGEWIESEFSSRASELGRGIEVRRIGDPLFWIKIRISSSNIIDELWGMGIENEFTSRANELTGKIERIIIKWEARKRNRERPVD